MSGADDFAFGVGGPAPEPPPRPVYPAFAGLPESPALLTLRARGRQFVPWGFRLNKDGDRWVKKPIDIRTGRGASVSDPETWCSYAEAVAYALDPENWCSGIGYMMSADDGLGGGDLDGVVDDAGDMEPWAADLLAEGETYAELSPSGRGVRIFGLGKPDKAHVCNPAQVEVYGAKRWLSLTGRHVAGTPAEIRPAPATFAALIARVHEFKELLREEAAREREARGEPIREAKPRDPDKPPTYLDRVNAAAFGNPRPWVDVLFGGYAVKAAAGGWRVPSHHLCRDLDEDLSLNPLGFVDFGVRDMGDPREGKRSAVDLVVEWAELFGVMDAAPSLFEAAHWLCARLGVTPESMGWKVARSASDHFDADAAKAADDGDRGWPFRLALRGVERRVEITDRATGETTIEWRWLCSHLEVAAHTRDADGDDWGRLLVVRDRDGRSKEWAMPMAMLAGEGVAYRERLLSMGLTMAPGKSAREALHEYVSTARPRANVHCVGRIGWHGRSFALPDTALQSAASGERTVLQNGTKLDNAIRCAGSIEAWKRDVAALAVGNSRLALALSTAFAAPVLHLIGGESGGFHLRGASSSGKSTALVVAGSAWGGGGIRGYQRLWRATSNGLEGVAALHCDALLCLDEIGQVDGREAGAIAYMLANGIGKSRAGRSGEARASAEWRLLFLSSGEISLSDKMAEDGRRSAVGQEVRLVDIEADAGRGLGLFEDLHGFAGGDAFARHLKAAAGEHYGHAARAFLRNLVDDLDAAAAAIARSVGDFLAGNCPAGADGQVSRICGRFGLAAAAGAMATGLGILPWPEGEAQRAAARCFRDWLRKRGDARPAEERAAISAVRRFVELHGGSRFEPLGDHVPQDVTGHARDHRVVNRAGFRRRAEGGGAEYLILPEVWRTEVCAGLDASAVARTLAAQNLLAVDREGKPQVKVRVPSAEKPLRLYVVRAAILDGAQEADVEMAA